MNNPITINTYPEHVQLITDESTHNLCFDSSGEVTCGDVSIHYDKVKAVLSLGAKRTRVRKVLLKWDVSAHKDLNRSFYLADHWERSYGDLEWRGLRADRVMPWYFMQHTPSGITHGYGVRVRPSAMCYWRINTQQLILGCDVRSGGRGVDLRGRTMTVCQLVSRKGLADENAFNAAVSFTRMLNDKVMPVDHVIYGANDWYYIYGQNTQETVLRDTQTISELSPNAANRPYSVIDSGWQLGGGVASGGPWVKNKKFPDFESLPQRMKDMGTRPGIWVRPSAAEHKDLPILQREKIGGDNTTQLLDISTSEVREDMNKYLHNLVNELGFELVKHDFSSWDIFGKPGYHFHDRLTSDDWEFADNTRSTAEILIDHYSAIAEYGDNAIILGCNCPSHLIAGLCHINRTGGDTSGMNWERTRIQGVNTLAFRMPQHKAFYEIDADCVGLTHHIPWEMNREWLRVLAHSGTPLFVSLDPASLGTEQRRELEECLAIASQPLPMAEPLDWMTHLTPSLWRCHDGDREFTWNGYPGEDFVSDVVLYQ